jgi:UDP-N-acetylmuramoylalanine--D-glutamate ligase
MSSPLYLVAGLGKTGLSIARYLARRHQSFVVFDTRAHPYGLDEFKGEFPNVEVFLERLPEYLYDQIEEIISSPGVALDEPSIKKARDLGISVIGDIECLAREIKAPVIAITGTNGKSTVTVLVGEIAKAAGFSVAVAGNIGTPVLDLLDDEQKYDLWVLELSSFQLDLTYSLQPKAVTILNVTPDHLDRHHGMDAYVQAKQRIYHHAKTWVFNRQDRLTFPVQDNMKTNDNAISVSFGLDAPSGKHWGLWNVNNGEKFLSCGQLQLLSETLLKIKGQHNILNALAACALTEAIGIDYSSMVKVLTEFGGLPHRSQWVRTLQGVEWINDSKGTNIGATISAISGIGGTMQGKIVLIAGGLGKGADFSELRAPVADFVRSVVLIGQDAPQIEEALGGVVPATHAASLEEAVGVAKTLAEPGDVVLLSPACASWDMFRDFNHRGDVFTRTVDAL